MSGAVAAFLLAQLWIGAAAGVAEPTPSAPTASAPTQAPQSAGVSSSAPGAPRSALAAALQQITPPSVAAGDGTIHGRALDPAGAALAGVTVLLEPVHDTGLLRYGQAAPPRGDLESAVRRAVSGYRERRQARRTVTTDADGRYRAGGLGSGLYRVTASLTGHQLEPRGLWHAVRPDARIDFRARVVAGVRIAVVGPNGRPPASASIEYLVREGGGERTRWWEWTPAAPVLELPPGRYRLRARAGGTDAGGADLDDSPLASPATWIELARGAGASVTLQLQARAGVAGRVLLAPGELADYPEVYVLRVPDGARPDPRALRRNGRTLEWGLSNGRFAFLDLAAGRYLVGATREADGAIVVSRTVRVDKAVVEIDLQLPPTARDDVLVVTVLGPDGTPASDARFGFTCTWASGGGWESSGVQAVAKPKGEWWITLPEEPHDALRAQGRGGRAIARCVLEVSSKRHGRATLDLLQAPAGGTVRLAADAWLSLTVSGYAGGPWVDRLRVGLAPADLPERHHSLRRRRQAQTPTADTGRRELGPFSAGEYILTLYLILDDRAAAAGGLLASSSLTAVGRVPVTLRPGRNELTVPLPGLHQLRVEVTGEIAGNTVTLTPAGDPSAMLRTKYGKLQDGVATFERLPAGRYTLKYWAGGKVREREIQLPGDEQVRIDATKDG